MLIVIPVARAGVLLGLAVVRILVVVLWSRTALVLDVVLALDVFILVYEQTTLAHIVAHGMFVIVDLSNRVSTRMLNGLSFAEASMAVA